jgi:hypothetical protein
VNDDFSFRATKDGRVMISWRGRPVVTLKGARAASVIEASSHLDSDGLQLLLARVTGNFKRGNERHESKS